MGRKKSLQLLEDLAGNSLVRVFDRDLTRAEDNPASDRPITLAFACPARPSPD